MQAGEGGVLADTRASEKQQVGHGPSGVYMLYGLGLHGV